MNWQEYTEKTKETAVYPGTDARVHPNPKSVSYLALGLAGETGEVVDVIKKQLRKEGSWRDPEFLANVRLELGDLCWYAAQLMDELGLDFEEVLQANLDKLAQRKAEGTLKERRASGGFIVNDIALSAADRDLLLAGGYVISAASLREAQASTRLDGETIEIDARPVQAQQRKGFFVALEALNERDELVDPAERDD